MKALTLLVGTLLASSVSVAEVIECGFTEPFVSLTYNTATEVLVEHEAVMEKTRTLKGVTFQIKSAGTFLLKDKSGKLVAELKLNNQGSDGMSDAIYPFDAKYIGALGMKGHELFGGCTSSLRPMVKDAQ